MSGLLFLYVLGVDPRAIVYGFIIAIAMILLFLFAVHRGWIE